MLEGGEKSGKSIGGIWEMIWCCRGFRQMPSGFLSIYQLTSPSSPQQKVSQRADIVPIQVFLLKKNGWDVFFLEGITM